MPFTVGVLTVSDSGARGEREDTSGPAIRAAVARVGGEVRITAIVPDERDRIAATLAQWADERQLDVILTTGGTGLSPRDWTPEATLDVLERQAPAIPQALLMMSLQKSPHAMLSRAVAGIRGRTLIINLPGSLKAVTECMELLAPVLPHAVEVLRGEARHEEIRSA